MGRELIESVPNFSEGRDLRAVGRIVEAIASAPGVLVLGQTSDPDHNRSVVTFAGPPAAVIEGAFRGVARAVELIDLSAHTGVHPRIGAADVVPLVPLEDTTLEQCASLATTLGERIWQELRVPVYLYEAAARRPDHVRLENIRRGRGQPDIGGPAPHPTAGSTVVGARGFLIAWNVLLASSDLSAAKRIARAIRESSGGLPHVKALGLPLTSRGLVQVSINLTDFEATPLPVVYERILREAAAAGVAVLEPELIGFLPRRAWEQIRGTALRFPGFSPAQIIEDRIAALSTL